MKYEEHRLGDLVKFTTGKLLPRITDTIDEIPSRRMIYNPLAETTKYIHGDSDLPVITSEQVGISMLQREAYLVEDYPQVDEQVLTANFTAVTFNSQLDRGYFVWWFNHSIEAQRQLKASGQLGRRVVASDLRKVTISVPDLLLQKDIGCLYAIGQKQALTLKEKADLMEEHTLQFISQKMMKE
ncbi:hypothetical protein [Levilactobacillus zymae]|uniref:hypothetical protein n=1 Tax=Levilactobacillus zymae TaxID=267363 RepID=UPI0028B8969A|nr:hypothetical protein [Levilactobacillus zymae]MDT6979472.1 hypothetical protein [Levilactobacillus zymae]